MSGPEGHVFTARLGNDEISFETGRLAQQAGGSIVVRNGESIILMTATASENRREGIDFLPLSVEFEEKLYAAGRIPGSFFRREGRPSEEAVLTCRLIDRPLRPLFDKSIRHEVQVIATVLSSDSEHHLDIMALNAASAALMISDIPWDGPIGGVRIGLINEELVINPSLIDMENSSLDLRVAGTKEAVLMVEAGADEVSEDILLDALQLAHEAIQDIIALQWEMQEKIGKAKREMATAPINPLIQEKVDAWLVDHKSVLLNTEGSKHEQSDRRSALKDDMIQSMADLVEAEATTETELKKCFSKYHQKVVRQRILDEGVRPDGRKTDEIRSIWCEVDVLPRTHGTGLFTRGETQVLSVATLGTADDEQRLDTLSPQTTKSYLHHYNFPPFSVGETGRIGGTKRREVGHGALAERALMPVLPDQEDFPYTLRVVSETLGSNGSSSMASVCGSTLSLMNAGVPISSPVSGIAMGLITDAESGKFAVLSDIQGLEDALGDMDFKVAGTRNGITALQMDIKISGIEWDIFRTALAQAHEGRNHILDVMEAVISKPSETLSRYAPQIIAISIDPEKIGKVIGPGGKTIRAIQDETDTRISIDDDGTVQIASNDGESAALARTRVEELTASAEEGQIYTGKVVRVVDFGAFVEILPGTDGLVHISQIADRHVPSIHDEVAVGDEIMVMVTNIAHDGKIRLSRQAVLEGWSLEEAQSRDRGGKRKSGGRGRSRR